MIVSKQFQWKKSKRLINRDRQDRGNVGSLNLGIFKFKDSKV